MISSFFFCYFFFIQMKDNLVLWNLYKKSSNLKEMDFSQLDFFWETQKLDSYLKDVDNLIVSWHHRYHNKNIINHERISHYIFYPLQKQIDRDPEDFKNKNNESDVKTLVEDISTGASNLAQSMCTREKTRQKIFNESRNVKVAVDDLFTEYDRCVCYICIHNEVFLWIIIFVKF